MDDLEKCKDSISQIKKAIPDAIFKATEEASDWPKGCYLLTSSGSVYFNEHDTGSNHSLARHICKGLGKKNIQNSTSIFIIKHLFFLEKLSILSILFKVTFTAHSYVGRWERSLDKCKTDCSISSYEKLKCIFKCNGGSSEYTVLASTVVWDDDSTGTTFGTFDGVNKIQWSTGSTWTKQGGIYIDYKSYILFSLTTLSILTHALF